MNEFSIGLSICIVLMLIVASQITHRANVTIRKLYQECGMAAEACKYSSSPRNAYRRLIHVMNYAKNRHSGLKFIEQYEMAGD